MFISISAAYRNPKPSANVTAPKRPAGKFTPQLATARGWAPDLNTLETGRLQAKLRPNFPPHSQVVAARAATNTNANDTRTGRAKSEPAIMNSGFIRRQLLPGRRNHRLNRHERTGKGINASTSALSAGVT
ncbi:unnamed protein product, partial [Iphiclides podalirius]